MIDTDILNCFHSKCLQNFIILTTKSKTALDKYNKTAMFRCHHQNHPAWELTFSLLNQMPGIMDLGILPHNVIPKYNEEKLNKLRRCVWWKKFCCFEMVTPVSQIMWQFVFPSQKSMKLCDFQELVAVVF